MAARGLGMHPTEPTLGVPVPARADVVYFLMFGGWQRELRSNRWYWARRWAHHVPVVLVQPEQLVARRRLVDRTAPIENCRVLEIKSSRSRRTYGRDGLVQLAQVAADMERHGFKRPLLWLYNPQLVALYAGVPAVGRVMHATENYFHFETMSPFFLRQCEAAIATSDVVLAVSDGVAASIAQHVPRASVAAIGNGCDYRVYAAAVPDPELAALRPADGRIAIYAGNINARVDLALLLRCVREHGQMLFTFFGPVAGLAPDDAARWKALLAAPNVRYFGPVDADRLPNLYGAADVGIIPYRQTPLLVENGFPLKALDMCATGLPVVSTLMKPIRGLAAGLAVVDHPDAFVAALRTMCRDTVSAAEQAEMRRVCEAHDYDTLFARMLAIVSPQLDEADPVTRLDTLVSGTLDAEWRALATAAWRASRRDVLGGALAGDLGDVLLSLHERLPGHVQRMIPERVRSLAARLLHGAG